MTEHLVHINVTSPRAHTLTYPAPGQAVVEEVNLPQIEGDMVEIRTLFSGISRGTESLVFNGLVPPSQWETMRCPHMRGDFSFPLSYGYACVGEVVSCGPQATLVAPGDHVFILHPHQDRIVVSQTACNPVPKSVPPARAVLAANMETALNAVWDAEADKNTPARIAVIGAGIVGLLIAHAIMQETGLSPVIFDINPERLILAGTLGFIPAIAGEDETDEFDLLFHTTANQTGLQAAIDMAGFEATIIEMSWYGQNPVTLDLGGAFHSRRLRIISSQVGTIARSRREKLGHSERMQNALSLLEFDKLDLLLEKPVEFNTLPGHLADILAPCADRLCQLVKYG